jgi:hypothetical protein
MAFDYFEIHGYDSLQANSTASVAQPLTFTARIRLASRSSTPAGRDSDSVCSSLDVGVRLQEGEAL